MALPIALTESTRRAIAETAALPFDLTLAGVLRELETIRAEALRRTSPGSEPLAGPLERVGPSQDPGFDVLHLRVGTGPDEVMVGLDPHGQEAAGTLAMMRAVRHLVRHDVASLRRRTYHLVLGRPFLIACNDAWAAGDVDDVRRASRLQVRNRHGQHYWSYPKDGALPGPDDNPATRAMIALAESVQRTPGHRLVLWLEGHCANPGMGGAVHVSTGHASRDRAFGRAMEGEVLASGVPLDTTTFSDGRPPHRGTAASFAAATSDAAVADRVTDSAAGWAHRRYGIPVAFTELPIALIQPGPAVRPMTLEACRARYERQLRPVVAELLPVGEIIRRSLPMDDALVADACAWATQAPDNLYDSGRMGSSTVLDRAQVAKMVTSAGLLWLRNYAPVLRVRGQHQDRLTHRQHEAFDRLEIAWHAAFRDLTADVTIEPVPTSRSVAATVGATEALTRGIERGLGASAGLGAP